ncbi:hypothetical protein SAMN05216266_11676 [Amycolatopsis marina]|uniref:Uncharacterized protein n=1 Tax=Amycolatopsis marina TaxID=490629 RepID=A0A1I1BVM6_9PSEU|nr:hypothetical protein [Amycolatopsis marina]SFB52708.1 hypothetical protein SAMN05216266_11676 [Amycolatopsis marina]
MAGDNAVVLSGTGLLDDVVTSLTADGWNVVLPSRRHNPIAARKAGPGRAFWVEAQWERPRDLVRRVERALPGPAGLLVAWVHESYRRSVLGAIESLLATGAPVVEVRASAGVLTSAADATLAAHPTQLVLLGTASERDPSRALSLPEISAAVLDAVRRARRGGPPSLHQVGQRRPVRS